MKPIFHINPLIDPRWPALLEWHPRATVFHSSEWLSALHATYGYTPVVYTTSPPDSSLGNGWVFCEVRSWLTGRRLVSLPFSDHCQPLTDNPSDLQDIARTLQEERERHHWDYVQFRPQSPPQGNIPGFQLREPFYLHSLDLRPALDQIFRRLATDSIQRKIRRAERDTVGYDQGTTESLVDRFYALLCRTRQRHGIPPQPRNWFSHLFSSLRDRALIRLASKNGKPVGALLTIRYKNVLVYKYSCGDPEYFKHGTMQLLLWHAIEDAKAWGLEELDFGRSDFGDQGLMLYKERWGAVRSETGYFQCSARQPARPGFFRNLRIGSRLTRHTPPVVLAAAGRILYKHFG